MADLSDITAWFSGQSEKVCYPNGTSTAPITGSGKKITIVRGWPDPKSVDAAVLAGNAMVSVYPMPGMERNTTRFPKKWQQNGDLPVAHTVLTVGLHTVTISGTPTVGEAATITVGVQGYGYQILAGDTVNTVAAALAALIPGASAVGAVITITGLKTITAAVSVTGTVTKEMRRQTRIFGIYAWAPDPATRDLIIAAIDGCLADTERFTVASDNTSARLIYHGTNQSDELQVRKTYKRWLMYSVEYATTQTEQTQTVGAFSVGITSSTS